MFFDPLIESTVYLLIFRQNSKGALIHWQSLFHQRIKTGGVLIYRWIIINSIEI